MTKEDLLKKLEKDKVNNIEAINSIKNRNYNAKVFGESFILFHEDLEENEIYIDCNSKEEIDELVCFLDKIITDYKNSHSLKGNPDFIVKGNFLKKYLMDKYDLKNEQRVFPCYLDKDVYVFPVSLPNIYVRELRYEDAPYVKNNYHTSEIYIKSRIKVGMIGAFNSNDKQIGFIGNHDDGSMGLLFVDEEYRRMGVASLLEYHLIEKLRKDGRLCFGQIETGNEASMVMHEKNGYEIGTSVHYWLY